MDYYSIYRWFRLLERRSMLFIASECQAIGITAYEYILLVNLYKHEGISQEEMAALLLFDKAAIARIVKSLEEKGFLLRIRNADDKRVKRLHSSAQGKKQMNFILSLQRRWLNHLCQGMEPETAQTIMDGLKHLSERALAADFKDIG